MCRKGGPGSIMATVTWEAKRSCSTDREVEVLCMAVPCRGGANAMLCSTPPPEVKPAGKTLLGGGEMTQSLKFLLDHQEDQGSNTACL